MEQRETGSLPVAAAPRTDMWSHLLRAVAGAIVTGLVFTHPASTTFVIVAFGVLAFVAGAVALFTGVRRLSATRHGWAMILEGIGGIAVGIIIFGVVHSLMSLVWTIAGWAVGIGAIVTVFAAIFRAKLPEPGLWFVGGLALIVLGAGLFFATEAGLLASGYLLGCFAALYALAQAYLAFAHRQAATAQLRPR